MIQQVKAVSIRIDGSEFNPQDPQGRRRKDSHTLSSDCKNVMLESSCCSGLHPCSSPSPSQMPTGTPLRPPVSS